MMISVIMPVWNFIADAAVPSVMQQSLFKRRWFSNIEWELLICDDGSTDKHALYLMGEYGKWPHVTVLQNTRTKGCAGARNTAAYHSQAQWLAFLDSDDAWTQDSLKLRWKQRRGQTWIAGNFKERTRTGEFKRSPMCSWFPQKQGFFHLMTCLIKRDAFLSIGGFDESLQREEDFDLTKRLMKISPPYIVPHELGIYRRNRRGSLTYGTRVA
jgi:glycosyltransferase involved in cell wall biosynthesis